MPKGRIICNKYEQCKVIGEGTFGLVVLAKKLLDDTEVAIKILRKNKHLSHKVTMREIAIVREKDILKEMENQFIIKLLSCKSVRRS